MSDIVAAYRHHFTHLQLLPSWMKRRWVDDANLDKPDPPTAGHSILDCAWYRCCAEISNEILEISRRFWKLVYRSGVRDRRSISFQNQQMIRKMMRYIMCHLKMCTYQMHNISDACIDVSFMWSLRATFLKAVSSHLKDFQEKDISECAASSILVLHQWHGKGICLGNRHTGVMTINNYMDE